MNPPQEPEQLKLGDGLGAPRDAEHVQKVTGGVGLAVADDLPEVLVDLRRLRRAGGARHPGGTGHAGGRHEGGSQPRAPAARPPGGGSGRAGGGSCCCAPRSWPASPSPSDGATRWSTRSAAGCDPRSAGKEAAGGAGRDACWPARTFWSTWIASAPTGWRRCCAARRYPATPGLPTTWGGGHGRWRSVWDPARPTRRGRGHWEHGTVASAHLIISGGGWLRANRADGAAMVGWERAQAAAGGVKMAGNG
jgi:hypothetical protein